MCRDSVLSFYSFIFFYFTSLLVMCPSLLKTLNLNLHHIKLCFLANAYLLFRFLKKYIYHWWGFLSWVFCFSHSDCGKALIFNIQHNCDILKWLYLTKHLNYLSLSLFKKYYTQITNGFSFFFIWCRTIIWTFWNGLISWPTDILFLKDAKTS